jgi:ankyrin repeat protein
MPGLMSVSSSSYSTLLAAEKAFKIVQTDDVAGLSKFLATRPQLISARNANGSTLLHVACWTGNVDMVKHWSSCAVTES